MQKVQEINFLVQDFLNSDLTERVLHYRKLSTLNFLILFFRLSRAGPLLNLTWDDVRTIKKAGFLDTDAHKTGKFYDVTIRIECDQHKWLKRLIKRFIKELKISSNLVFPAPTNIVEHSMAKNIRVVSSQLFEKRSDKDFHATAVRKMWDTHFHNIRKSYKDSVFNSHLEQTGHSANTARDKYVIPVDETEVLRTYLSELSKLQDSSVGEERVFQIEFPTSTPQETKKSSNSFSAESNVKLIKTKPGNKVPKVGEIFPRE